MIANSTRIHGVHKVPQLHHIPVIFDDWYLPSKDGVVAMYTELHLFGLGGFLNAGYWSSTESDALGSKYVNFITGISSVSYKSNGYRVRACRSFTAGIGAYSLRDIGPAGGLIFYIDGTTYFEAAPSNQDNCIWSNVSLAIGTTSDLIEESQNNTDEIIAQAGHTTSAAKLCDDLII